MKNLFLVIIASLGISTSAIGAPLPVNAGFETGDFAGWRVTIPTGISEFSPFVRPAGTALVLDEFHSVAPVAGDEFAVIGTAASAFLVPGGVYDIYASQTMELDAGVTLSGWSSFYNGDFEAQDSAWVRIFDSLGKEIATPWLQISGSGASVPYRSATPWMQWQWEAPVSGTYTLALGVTTFGDDRFDSYGLYDAIGTPEPSSVWLLGMGIAALFIRRRLARTSWHCASEKR